jgi:pimeloyl-ACP methyl ester carboxylesterase
MKCFFYLLYILSSFNEPLAYQDKKSSGLDTTGKYALVNGINIYYEEYGTGEPLLLLHGNSQSIKDFKMQIPEFAKHYHVIAVDTRGHGKSGDDGKKYSYNLFAEDMNALLKHLKISKTNIVGWSDGGNTGLTMAMKYPDKVKKLAVMGANIFIDSSVVDNWVFEVLNQELKELQNDTAQWSKNRIRRINLLLTEPKYKFSDLKKITCPVLVLAGEKDIVKEGHTRNIAKNIAKATLLIAPNETHEFPQENPNSFNKIILDFLKKNAAADNN